MIKYTDSLQKYSPEDLEGFFVGWPNPPSQQKHYKILQNSYCYFLAIDSSTKDIIGFINAISDGILSAYIPLLEVRPAYQNRGIATKLVHLLTHKLENFYMLDVICDKNLESFYEKNGFIKQSGMVIRNYDFQNGK